MKGIYVKFDSLAIKGESQDRDHKDRIEINSWSQTVNQPRSAMASTVGGHIAERYEYRDMAFMRDLGVVSPLLYQHTSGGTTLDEVAIEFLRIDSEGNRVEYPKVKLKNAIPNGIDSQMVVQDILTDMFSLHHTAV